jgi:hypothetical protein
LFSCFIFSDGGRGGDDGGGDGRGDDGRGDDGRGDDGRGGGCLRPQMLVGFQL